MEQKVGSTMNQEIFEKTKKNFVTNILKLILCVLIAILIYLLASLVVEIIEGLIRQMPKEILISIAIAFATILSLSMLSILYLIIKDLWTSARLKATKEVLGDVTTQ